MVRRRFLQKYTIYYKKVGINTLVAPGGALTDESGNPMNEALYIRWDFKNFQYNIHDCVGW